MVLTARHMPMSQLRIVKQHTQELIELRYMPGLVKQCLCTSVVPIEDLCSVQCRLQVDRSVKLGKADLMAPDVIASTSHTARRTSLHNVNQRIFQRSHCRWKLGCVPRHRPTSRCRPR